MEYLDVVVIGGGQSGLATAHALLRRGLRPVVLEASDRAAGSWPHYYDSLTLFSPARYSSLPGMPFPGADRDRYPHRDEVAAYLTAYADRLDAEIRTGCRVSAARRTGSGFEMELEGGGRLSARAVVAASGTFGRPHRPALPGLQEFTGQVLHAADYRSPAPFAGRRVVVVGAGNSAVQIAAELAKTARVTLATRGPVKFAAQRVLGRDLHFWTARTGLDTAPLGRFLARPPAQPVLDDGRYRAALAAGRPDRRPLLPAPTGPSSSGRTGGGRRSTRSCSPLATAPTCPTSPASTAPWTPTGTPGTARASPSGCRGWRSWGWSGSAACRRTRYAASDGTRNGSPGAWPPTSHAGDGPLRTGSTCVNIGACRMRRCCRCSNPPTAKVWRRAARR
ncbi:flavin-containing monooxygenase [Streptomyces cinereoruber]|uniref:flavin-containing monooxygenase n=1 Tax=Streptomyces cinereoruber TaxID=67260 RepID=UPI003EB965E5